KNENTGTLGLETFHKNRHISCHQRQKRRGINMNRLIPRLALILTLLATLAGCGGKDQSADGNGPIEISFLTQQLSPTFTEYIEGLVAEFEASHPGVKVKWLDYPYDGYETKIITSYMANQSPDVINLGSESIPEFAGRGYLLPLNGQ